MPRNQSWQQENGCLVPPTAWTGMAFSMQHIHDAMTTSYHAKRQRANSVPCGHKSSIPSDTGSRFDTARTNGATAEQSSIDTDDPEDIQSPSIIQVPEQAHNAPVPHWQRELAKSRVGRHSRASSIISTRTRLTVQSDDARSVDIEAGGQSYHINRDGSMVTNVTAPPPYPGPPLHQLDEESDEEDPLTRLSSDTVRDDPATPEVPHDRSLQSLPIRTHLPPTVSIDGAGPTTTLGKKASAFELPRPFRQVLNLSWYRSPMPIENSVTPALIPSTKSLRRTKSDSSSLANFRLFEPASLSDVNGIRVGDSSNSDADDSPSADGSWPKPLPHLPPDHLDPSDERTAEVSAHYTRLIRTIDRSHRARLHDLNLEVSRLQELLNEKDIIYRQQLRDRDHIVNELNGRIGRGEHVISEARMRIEEMEEGVERRIEKARHEVEDVWEARWKEYERCLRERLLGGKSVGSGMDFGGNDENMSGNIIGSTPNHDDAGGIRALSASETEATTPGGSSSSRFRYFSAPSVQHR